LSRPINSFAEFEEYVSRFTNYERMRLPKYDKYTFGIERMRSFAQDIGNPQYAYPSVHVAGTKGKGSTCLLLEAFLLEEGYSVGTYLSPHVEHMTERIRVDGEPAGGEEIVEELNGMLDVLEGRREAGPSAYPSFFELMTALAMATFRSRKVDWAIFEVGLGGRLDATNILEPRVCAITSIGLEHTEQLGDTLAQIAREKAGIIKPGVPVILGPLCPEADEEIVRIAAERAAPVVRVAHDSVLLDGHGGIRIAGWDGVLEQGPVVGPGLRTDLGIALDLLRHILASERRTASRNRVATAVSRVVLPARIEIVPGSPPVVIDAAHTTEAVRTLRLSLEEVHFPRPRTLVFSIAVGKRIDAILEELPGLAEEFIWTLADPLRSVEPLRLCEGMGRGEIVESPEEALELALARGKPVIVTGSFYLAGRLRRIVRTRKKKEEP